MPRSTSCLVACCAAGAGLLAVGARAFAVAPSGHASIWQPSSTAVDRATLVQGAGPWGAASASSARGLNAALVALAAAGAAALIVQNKGGGHGEIGYHLAKELSQKKGLQVTMIQDSKAKKDKPPFNSYADLEAAGVKVIYADLEGGGLAAAMAGVGPCEYVFDNQNVCPGDVQKAVKAWNPKAYAYVSSGGMYKPVGDGPLLETGAVKEDNAQLAIERSAAANGLAWSAFRPQYIYGPKTNKREYLDWFFDRITRGVKFPLPVDGSMRTTVTNAEDVAGMLASVVGKEAAAKGQVFNCATDVRVSHKEILLMCCKAAGKDPFSVLPNVVYYDPAALKGIELPKKGKFPFRESHFGVGVEKAKDVLRWYPKHTLEEDLPAYYAEYVRLGKNQGPIENEWDEAVIRAVKAHA